MATGIQTSVQRGRRSQLSARPTTNENRWSKAISLWSGLEKKVKFGIGGLLLLLILGGSFKAHDVQSNTFGELYPLKLNNEDVTEISSVLTNSGIEHTISPTMDGIQMHPDDVRKARALLASHSLPRHNPAPPAADSSMPTADMRKAAERRRLESELVYTLRQMEGVNDARVKLAMPPKTFFRDDQVAVKASVFLDLAKTYQMTPEVAQGIASLVSHSVPELQPENVTLLNSQGKEIDASAPDQLDVVSEREVELQKKLQGALARIFGERVHTVVNVEYDTSHEESRRWTPGDPKHEGVIADSSQLMEEFLDGESKEDGKKYGVTKKAVNYVYSQNSLVNVRMQPKIDRITATVMVDGASEEELAAVAGIVKGAIGIDESRLDNVFVTGLPWNHKVWEETPEPPVAAAPPQESANLLWEALGLGMGMFLLGLVGAGLLGKRTNPLLGVSLGSSESHNGINGIVDHGSNKNGQTTQMDITTCNGNRMEALENLVTSKPESVASLLRTTWLKH